MARNERLSLEARIWEQKQMRKLGLRDVPWDPTDCCEACKMPVQKEEEAPGAAEEAQDQMEPVPPSGTRERWETEEKTRRKQS